MLTQFEKKCIAGPCAVESHEQILQIAFAVKKCGGTHLRGGAYKPRTSPRSFQGLGKDGVDYLVDAGKQVGLPVVTELVDIAVIDCFADVDIIQIGARNMQNFELLKQLGRSRKTILLKRGFGNTTDELMKSAEYIVSGGNSDIILCERGIRTFEPCSRFTLDLAAVLYLKKKSGFPVIVDPSHAAGVSWMVPPLAKAAAAVGADGIMVEVNDNSEKALCDGQQAITSDDLGQLIGSLSKIWRL